MLAYQVVVILVLSLIAGILSTSTIIPVLKHRQFQQFIREEGPKSHLKKEGTPTMGGIAIYASIIVTCLVGYKIDRDLWFIVLTGFLFGLIGFFDDYIKVTARQNLGLRAWQKLVLQILLGVIFGIYVMNFTDMGDGVWIPFLNKVVSFGPWFVPFVAFVIVAMANSVNLTDGMDGLCGGVSAIFAFSFALIAIHFEAIPSAIYLLAMCGACIGFVVFNRYPAQLFMGDTGSMAIGGGLTAAVVMTRAELLIPIGGLVFVLEALSVIMQVTYFKATGGKRIFRMAPLHHHFEEGGMKEQNVVIMFWIFAAICCFAAVGTAMI